MPRPSRLIALAVLLPLCAQTAGAQDRESSQTGLLVGWSMFSISHFDAQLPPSSQGPEKLRTKPLGHGMYGVYVRFPMNDALAVETDLLFETKGAINEEREPSVGTKRQRATVQLSYLELPVLLRFTAPAAIGAWHPFTVIGASGGYQRECKYRATLSDFDGYASCGGRLANGDPVPNRYSRWELGAVAGVGMTGTVRRNQFNVQLRYVQGLTNAVRVEVDQVQHNRGLMLMAGIEMR